MLNSTLKALFNKFSPLEGLGDQLNNQLGMIVGSYDFAVQGGAALAVIPLLDVNTGLAISLPVGTIITTSYVDVQTPCVGAGSIALSTGQTAADILAATAAASITGTIAGVSTGVVANFKKISTTPKTPIATLSVGTITAGKFLVFMEFVQSA
jgi:hypothetical protein